MAKPEEKTILVVDDEQDVRDYLSMVLEDAGFKIMTAEDGNQALERLKEQVPDFISLDLVMPGRSGMRFLREMRRHREWANIPFVVVTAHAHDDLGKDDLDDIVHQSERPGSNLVLEKPVKSERYLQVICERLGVETKDSAGQWEIHELRRELADLIQGAEPEQLRVAIKALKDGRQTTN